MKKLYFDYAAATPIDPEVLKAMEPYFSKYFGNASSIYEFGQEARHAIDGARELIANELNCKPREIIFTSGGTESNNMFVFGAARALAGIGKHIISTKIEHESVLKPLQVLESQGFEVTYLDVDNNGIVNPEDVKSAIRPDTIFASIIYANNEIGTVQPVKRIGEIIKKTKKHKPIFHIDACQAVNYLDISPADLNVDCMTLNSGKIYGPKGAGALYIKEGVNLVPHVLGGGQEYRLRAGTENVPAIVGFAHAFEIARKRKKEETKKVLVLRDLSISELLKIPDSRLNGHKTARLPNNVNVSFRGIDGGTILMRLDMLGISASAGSACSSGALEPSHVIAALGLSEEWSRSAVRFTLGRGNSVSDVKKLAKELALIISDLKKTSPF